MSTHSHGLLGEPEAFQMYRPRSTRRYYLERLRFSPPVFVLLALTCGVMTYAGHLGARLVYEHGLAR